jgi:hypothetical protein
MPTLTTPPLAHHNAVLPLTRGSVEYRVGACAAITPSVDGVKARLRSRIARLASRCPVRVKMNPYYLTNARLRRFLSKWGSYWTRLCLDRSATDPSPSSARPTHKTGSPRHLTADSRPQIIKVTNGRILALKDKVGFEVD